MLVYDEPFGLAEIKCPYSHQNNTPEQACSNKDFFYALENGVFVKLKRAHPYYSQIQGQLAMTQRKWCDFVVNTPKGLSIERVPFDRDFWKSELLPKLTSFFDNCLGPEIISPRHSVGLPIRNLSFDEVKNDKLLINTFQKI